MAQSAHSIKRTINLITTGPSAMPSRLAALAYDLTLDYSQVTPGHIKMSTSSAKTINFQGIGVARFVLLAADTRLKVRINGLDPIALGNTSSLSTARVAMWEGSITSMVVSNPSSAFIGNLSYILGGN